MPPPVSTGSATATPAATGPAAAISAVRRVVSHYLQLPPTVLILCLGSLINRAGSFVMLFMTMYVSEHLGFGVTFAASCFGAFGAGSVVASLTGGHLADRFGRKRVMLAALTGGIACVLSMSAAETRAQFLVLMFLFSATREMYRPAASAMISDVTTTAQRPLAFGLMYIAFNLGFAVAAPVGGFLAERSFRWLFWCDALTTGLYLVIIACFV